MDETEKRPTIPAHIVENTKAAIEISEAIFGVIEEHMKFHGWHDPKARTLLAVAFLFAARKVRDKFDPRFVLMAGIAMVSSEPEGREFLVPEA